MCDYSLHRVASRSAEVGDKLVSTKFGEHITRGFCAVEVPGVAVCLLSGTELTFEAPVKHDNLISGLVQTTRSNLARFTKINEAMPQQHHDALQFSDGQVVMLTRLVPGQHAVVLQLPAKVKMLDVKAPAAIIARELLDVRN